MAAANIGGTATTVASYPASGGKSTLFLFNAGGQTAFLGTGPGVSSATGLPLPPGSKADISNAAGTVYAVAGGYQVAPYGTANANTVYGGTALTLASGGTAFTAGMTVIIDPGTAKQEITSVASSNAGTVNVSPAMTFVHGSAATFSQYTPFATTLQVIRGAV